MVRLKVSQIILTEYLLECTNFIYLVKNIKALKVSHPYARQVM